MIYLLRGRAVSDMDCCFHAPLSFSKFATAGMRFSLNQRKIINVTKKTAD